MSGSTLESAAGMAEEPYFGDLLKAKVIDKADLTEAVEAYMTDRGTRLFPVGDAYHVDLAAAVAASPYARDMLADPSAEDASKRAAVGTAILMARPVKA